MSDKPAVINFDTSPPLQVVQYDNLITKFVPGYETIFQMVLAYLKTQLEAEAELLIVGAGSGKELLTFGQVEPGWSLTGVDPSNHMLNQARQKIAQLNMNAPVTLHCGLVQELPLSAQFDAATCILVMHFLPDDGSKLDLLNNIAARLKPGASLLLVDIYGGPDFVKDFGPAWRNHGQQMGLPAEQMLKLEEGHRSMYPISEARTLELFEQAGFEKVVRFYTALIYSGWIAYKG